MTMREILFRGKRVKPVALVSQWILGNYVFKADASLPGLGKHFIVVHDGFGLSQWVEVDPDTIGEYTGLTDKNGKKIFEGDIVKIDIAGLIFNAVCKFHSGSFGLVWHYMGVDRWQAFTSICHVEYEVIGNIHDTPELMEDEYHG